MQYSNRPIWSDSVANQQQENTYDREQRRNDDAEHQAGRQDLAAYNRVRESDASIGNDLKSVLTQQVRSEPESQYTSSGGQHVRQYSSASPSSKWSTASPSASWGTTQPDATKQPWLYGTVQSSSDRTLMDKAKEYLPGTGSGTADNSAQPSLLEKAKEYLPGASNTRSTGSWQGSDRSGLQQESATGGITGSHQTSTYSRPEAEYVPAGRGYSGHSDFGSAPVGQGYNIADNQVSTGRRSNTAGSEASAFNGSQGAASSKNLEYRANQDPDATGISGPSVVGQPEAEFKQHNAHPENKSDYESERDSLTGASSRFSHIAQRDSPVSNSSHQSKFSTSRPDSTYGNDGFSSQQSGIGHNGDNRPRQRYSSESSFASSATGIPPPFHAPSYLTQDTPQYQPYTGPTERQHGVSEQGAHATSAEGKGIVQSIKEYLPGQGSSHAADGVHATDALRPLTQIPADGHNQVDEVHAKEVLQPLTQIPKDRTAHDSRARGAGEEDVHARDALEPLTVLPTEGKGIVETVLEYLPGHATTSAEGQETQQSTAYASEPAQPGLFEKAKAYIPVIGSSTEFDPASSGRQHQEGRLYQESPLPQESLRPEGQSPSFVERAKAYVPSIGASGTTASGYDAQTGQGTSAPHTGLVESLVERVQEFVHPHHFAETPAETTATGQAPAAHSVADRAAGREIDPSVQGVRLTNYSTFGRDAGHSGLSQEAEAQQAPGMLDRVKQLVGLGPSTDTEENSTQRAPSSPIIASQGINAGILGGSGRVDSHAIDDDDFQDAVESPPESFTTSDTAYRSGAANQESKKPYVNQTGPPLVDTSNDPEETFGPVKQDRRAQPDPEPARTGRDTVGFGDESDDRVEADGKHGLRSRVKDKVGNKREHHHEKQRVKADHALEQKMQQKELKTEAVTTPAAPEQATKAPTEGSNLGPGGGAGQMGGVAGGTPADPQGNAQSQDKAASEQPPASGNSKNPKDPHTAVKANENAGSANIAIGGAAQQKMEEAPAMKSKGGFFGKLKNKIGRNKS